MGVTVTANANQTFTTTTPTIAAAASGHTLVMWIVNQRSPSARTVSSIASTNTTWAKLAGVANGVIDSEIWFGTVAGGSGGTTVTITMSGTGATVAGVITEFAGVRVKVTIPDGTAATNTGTSTSPTTAAFSELFLNSLLLSCVGYANGTDPSANPGGVWTDVTRAKNSTVCEVAGQYNLTGATGAASAAWTIGNVAWVTCIGALKEVNLEYQVSDVVTSAEKVQSGVGLFRIKDSISVSEKVQSGVGLSRIKDSVSVAENTRTGLGIVARPFETASVGDHFIVQYALDRPVSVSESITAKFGIVGRATDTISVVDLATAVLAGGPAGLQASVFDTLSVSEFVKAVIELGIRPAEAVAAAEFVKAALQLGARPFEVVAVSEFIASAVRLGIRPAEAISVAEFVKAIVNLGIRVSESSTVSEKVQTGIGLSNIKDSVSVSEKVQSGVGLFRISDAITAAEKVRTGIGLSKIGDSVSVAELAKAVLSPLAVQASDSVAITEAVKAALQLGVRPFEAITTSENTAALLNIVRLTLLASESISAADVAIAYLTPVLLAVSDVITILENVRVGLNLGSRLLEPVSVTESITASLDLVRLTALAAESATVSENVKAVITPLTIQVLEAVSVVENAVVLLVTKGALSVFSDEVISVLENVQALLKTIRITVNVNDSVSAAEFTKQPITPLEAALSETVTALENVKAALQLGSRPFESVITTESLAAQLTTIRLHVSTFEQLVVTENAKAVINPLLSKLLEAVTITEAAVIDLHNVRGLLVSLSEAVAVAEFVKALVSILAVHGQENVTVAESVQLLTRQLLQVSESISTTDFAQILLTPLTAKLQESSTVTEAVSVLVQLLRLNVSLAETLTVGEATIQVLNTIRGGERVFDAISTTEYLNLNIVNSTVIGLYAFTMSTIDASAKLLATKTLPFTLNPVDAEAKELAMIVVTQ